MFLFSSTKQLIYFDLQVLIYLRTNQHIVDFSDVSWVDDLIIRDCVWIVEFPKKEVELAQKEVESPIQSPPVPTTLNILNLDSAPMCFTYLHNKSEPLQQPKIKSSGNYEITTETWNTVGFFLGNSTLFLGNFSTIHNYIPNP